MNFIQFESSQKLRGGFYTDADLVRFLTRWINVISPERVLEPSCGDGAFIRTLQEEPNSHLHTIVACEIDPSEAAKARASKGQVHLEVHAGDFLRWFLFHGDQVDPFDGVVGNPPFIRYQYLPDEQQLLAERILKRFGLPFTKHTNAWVPFVIGALALLRPGGRLGMVVPSELFHIPHAQSLRRFLAAHCSKILVLDPDELWFGETLQGTVLLLAEKRRTRSDCCEGVAVVPIVKREQLSLDPEPIFQGAAYANPTEIEGKWMWVFLTRAERDLVSELRSRDQVRPFKILASVDVGIVTGANKFFLVPDQVVEEFGLQRWAYPMFGRSEHVRGLIYSEADHAENKGAGLSANFLWFKEPRLEELPVNAQRYLERGLIAKLPSRYKCRVRTPWYTVPSVYVTPVGMLKRAHNFPRLILNRAQAYTTDTAYRIQPLACSAEALVLSFVNSLTSLTAELEGRHYGGGVLELVPSEIERLLLPVIDCSFEQLAAADQSYRNAPSDVAFLRGQDQNLLTQIGLTTSEQQMLHDAWLRLRKRRQRSTALPAEEAE